jgi:hypothetical protein
MDAYDFTDHQVTRTSFRSSGFISSTLHSIFTLLSFTIGGFTRVAFSGVNPAFHKLICIFREFTARQEV